MEVACLHGASASLQDECNAQGPAIDPPVFQNRVVCSDAVCCSVFDLKICSFGAYWLRGFDSAGGQLHLPAQRIQWPRPRHCQLVCLSVIQRSRGVCVHLNMGFVDVALNPSRCSVQMHGNAPRCTPNGFPGTVRPAHMPSITQSVKH